jgi:hypothetical protein
MFTLKVIAKHRKGHFLIALRAEAGNPAMQARLVMICAIFACR